LENQTSLRRLLSHKVIVLDKEIKVEVSRVVIGRLTQTTVETASKPIDKVVTRVEEDNLYIYVADEKSYMSRLHTGLVKGGRAVFEGHGLAKQNGGLKGVASRRRYTINTGFPQRHTAGFKSSHKSRIRREVGALLGLDIHIASEMSLNSSTY